MNGKWVRALIDSSCSFSHMRQRFADGFVLLFSLYIQGNHATFLFLYFNIFSQGLYTYIPISISLLLFFCMCGQSFSYIISARKQNMNSVLVLFPVVSVLFFVLNRLAALLTGWDKTHETRVRFCILPSSFSLFIVAPQQATASKCRVLLFFSRSPSPLSLSATYIYLSAPVEFLVVVIRRRMNNSPALTEPCIFDGAQNFGRSQTSHPPACNNEILSPFLSTLYPARTYKCWPRPFSLYLYVAPAAGRKRPKERPTRRPAAGKSSRRFLWREMQGIKLVRAAAGLCVPAATLLALTAVRCWNSAKREFSRSTHIHGAWAPRHTRRPAGRASLKTRPPAFILCKMPSVCVCVSGLFPPDCINRREFFLSARIPVRPCRKFPQKKINQHCEKGPKRPK